MDDEKELIIKAVKGDKNSFGLLICKYEKRLYGFVYNIVQNQQAALDIVQESFIKAYKNLGKFNLNKNFSTWLFTIAKNTALNSIKCNKKYALQSELEDSISNTNNPEEMYAKKEALRALSEAVDKLQDKYKSLICLKYINNLTYEEISKALDIPINIVESRLYTARQKLSILLNRGDKYGL